MHIKPVISLVVLILTLICFSYANQDILPYCHGTIDNSKLVIECDRLVNIDETLDQIREAIRNNRTVWSRLTNIQFNESAQSINLTLPRSGKIDNTTTVDEKSLSVIPYFTHLTIGNCNRRPSLAEYTSLNIHPLTFQNAKNLTSLRMCGLLLTDDSLIAALALIKDQITALFYAGHCSPAEKVFQATTVFTNLKRLALWVIPDRVPQLPHKMFKKASSSLEHIDIFGCDIQSIKSNTFSGLKNLTTLEWEQNNSTEIESGALDDLENVQKINLADNHFSALPDGLFSKNKNLRLLLLNQSPKLQLTPANFTNFERKPRVWLSSVDGFGGD